MTAPPRGRCPVCGRSVALRHHDGNLRHHGYTTGHDDTCKGSGQPPEPAQPTNEPRQHDRRTQ
jgi:hypothetical protein